MKTLKINKRFFAGALLVLALLTLTFDYVSLSPAVKQELNMLGISGDSAEMLGRMLGMGMHTISSSDAKAASMAAKAMLMISSGGLSIVETRSLLGLVDSIMKLEGKGEPIFGILCFMLTVLLLITAFSGAFSLYGVYRRRRARGFWFAAMLLLLLIIEGFITVSFNEGSGWDSLVSITAWPFIGLASAIASIVLCFSAAKSGDTASGFSGESVAHCFSNVVRMGKAVGRRARKAGRAAGKAAASAAASAAANAASIIASANWTCPHCGKTLEGSARFCSACGCARPERTFCPRCGTEGEEGAAFCSQCGFKLIDPSNGAATSQACSKSAAQGWPEPDLGNDSLSPDNGTLRIQTDGQHPSLILNAEIVQQQTGFRQTCQVGLDDSLTVGRNSGCELRIDDGTVSGSHLRLDREGDEILVTDLHSCNGTRLNGLELSGPSILCAGDELILGMTRLVLRW